MRTLLKSLRRELRSSLSRFVAIFAITALGGSFFVGLTSVGPDMLHTATQYYEENRLADYRLLSTFGFTQEDVTALIETGDYSSVSAGYGLDVLVEDEGRPVPVRLHSVPAGQTDENALNRPEILEGRYPVSANECLADAASGEQIGDVITLSPENETDTTDLLAVDTFTVVGIAESPYYIYHTRGNTELGDGQLSRFYLVPESAFDSEYYLEVFLRDAAAEGLDSFSDAYDDTQQAGEARLEVFANEREQVRYHDILEEAEIELADARAELADGEVDLQQAREEADAEFADAEAEIADAEAELLSGQDELEAGRSELTAARNALESGRQELAQQTALLQSGQAAQAEGQAQYNAGSAQLASEREALLAGQAAYETGLAQYNAGLAQYNEGVAALQAGDAALGDLRVAATEKNDLYNAQNEVLARVQSTRNTLAAGLTSLQGYTVAEIDAYKQQTDALLGQLNAVLAVLPQNSAQITALTEARDDMGAANSSMDATNFDGNRSTIEAAVQAAVTALDAEVTAETASLAPLKAEAEALQAEVQTLDATLQAQRTALEATRVTLEQSMSQLQTSYAQLQAGMAAFTQGEAALSAAAEQLAQGEAELMQGSALLGAGNAQMGSAEAEIATGETELAEAEAELADGWAELAEGRQELADARAEAEVEFADAEAEIADAKAEIADAEAELADLDEPEWFVQTRESQPGYGSYIGSVDSLRALAGVFPVFFFLVSTLVCLTTMTRMVEEKRTQIGTLKALGYSKGAIAFEYLFYGTAASLSGAVVGAAIGITVFPIILFEAYSLMYNMPPLVLAIHPVYVPLSIGVSVLSTAGATLAACLGELHSVPAVLMRPKAPRAGKRILLERIRPVWRRMNFIQKVTSRNIFRYKKRFFMTVIGVSGCTALLLTGFGLNDTIGRVIPLQFDKINNYDATLVLSEPSFAAEETTLNENLSALGQALYLDQYSVEVTFGEEKSGDTAVYMLVPEETERLEDFLRFYEPTTEDPFVLNDAGVVLTQKLADILGAKAGAEVSLVYDDVAYAVPVAAVTENYFSNYVYISPVLYEELLGEAPEFDSVWLKTADGINTQTALETAMEDENVLGAIDSADFRREFSDMMEGLDAVVLLAIVSAGALGVVVLYNLTNINITERTREIATLKVLGFYPREFAAYVYRESFVLTMLGSLFGLLLGVVLHRFVMQAALVDDLLFVPYIAPLSYVLSVVFTLVSLAIVDAMMLRNLYKIDTVESLKSTE